jgi:protein-disulfide isomerase
MASRKEQKEQARAARLAAEQAAAARNAQMRRLQQLGGLIAGVVVVIVVVFLIADNGTSEKGLAHGKTANKDYQLVSAELQGIPQTGTTLGSPKAPVTLTYFGDLECPICQAFTLGVEGGGLPELISKDVRQGRVKIDYRSFCTATCNGPGQSVFNTQQVAAYAAGQQNLFWDYAELFYHEQGQEDTGYVTSNYLNGLAEQIPALDLTKWQTDRKDPALLSQVEADETAAQGDGVSGTPTLIATGPKGKDPIGSGVLSYSTLESAIKSVT